MGLLDTVKGLIGSDEEQQEGDYRCIRCGDYHDKDHHTCPSCGGEFVAPVPDE